MSLTDEQLTEMIRRRIDAFVATYGIRPTYIQADSGLAHAPTTRGGGPGRRCGDRNHNKDLDQRKAVHARSTFYGGTGFHRRVIDLLPAV